MTFDLGSHAMTHPENAFWTVSKKGVHGSKSKKPGQTRLISVSYHGTLEHALDSVIRLLADDKGAETLAGYLEDIRAVWADVKRTVQAGLGRARALPGINKENAEQHALLKGKNK